MATTPRPGAPLTPFPAAKQSDGEQKDDVAAALVLRKAGLDAVEDLLDYGELRLASLRIVGHLRIAATKRVLARQGLVLPWVAAEDERIVRTLAALMDRSPEVADRLSRDGSWKAAFDNMPPAAREATRAILRKRSIREFVAYVAQVVRVTQPDRFSWWLLPGFRFSAFLDNLEGFYEGVVAVALPASLDGVPRGGAKLGSDGAAAVLSAAGIASGDLLGQLTAREMAELAGRMGRGPALAAAMALQPGGPHPPVVQGEPRPADEPPDWAAGDEGRPSGET